MYNIARKGSKEIKNKNIIKFNGKPLICHTINQAKKKLKFLTRSSAHLIL